MEIKCYGCVTKNKSSSDNIDYLLKKQLFGFKNKKDAVRWVNIDNENRRIVDKEELSSFNYPVTVVSFCN